MCRIGDTGLTLSFYTKRDNDEFRQGETFALEVPETFQTTPSRLSEANLLVTGHPLEDHLLTLTILSSGGPGEARFSLKDRKQGTSILTDTLPECGTYELFDDMTLVFSDSTQYQKGMAYEITAVSNDESVNRIPLYVLLAGILLSGAGLWGYLAGRRETGSAYRIHRYCWMQEGKEYER